MENISSADELKKRMDERDLPVTTLETELRALKEQPINAQSPDTQSTFPTSEPKENN